MNINWTVVNEEATASDKIYLCSLHIERSGGCAEKKGCSTCCHKMGTKRWASALSSLCGIREMKCFDSKYFAKNWVCTKYYGGEILCKKILCTKCEQRDEKGIVRSKWWRRLCLPRAHRALQIQTQTKLQIQTQTKTKSESECSKQCFHATSVAKGSLEQLSEI